MLLCSVVALAVMALAASVKGQGQIYDICADNVIDPSLQKFSVISPGLGSPQGYGTFHRCHIDYPQTTTPRILRVTFPSFNVEKGSKCEHDSLRMGGAMLCGTWPQGRTMDYLVMPGKPFMFEFNSDNTGGHPGFVMEVQVGNYAPGTQVQVYQGRGDAYNAGSFVNTYCTCGTNQVYKSTCTCKAAPLTGSTMPSPAGQINSFRGGNSNSISNGMISTWAANQVSKGLNKAMARSMPTRPSSPSAGGQGSRPYDSSYFKRVSNSLTNLLNKGHAMSKHLSSGLNSISSGNPQPNMASMGRQSGMPQMPQRQGMPQMSNMRPNMQQQQPGMPQMMRPGMPQMMRPGMPGMMPPMRPGMPGMFGNNGFNSAFNALAMNSLMNKAPSPAGGEESEGGAGGGEGGAAPQGQGGWMSQQRRGPYGWMTTTAKPQGEEQEGGAATPAPSPWGQPPAAPSGDDDDEGGPSPSPAPPAYRNMGPFYRQSQPYGGQRNFGSQGARMPFPVMRGPGGRVQGGRYPQQMQFRPQMGQFPGQMRSSMGARGPMYGQQPQYGQQMQRFGQRQQQQQRNMNPFAPQIGPGGEISTHEAAPGGEQD